MAAPTEEELTLLSKFRERLTNLQLAEDQSSDTFLLRWIRARENKLDLAEDMLRKSLKWREEYGADSILKWEPPAMVLDLIPVETAGWDKDGCPVVVMPFGRWDLRSVIESGRRDDCVRYVSQLWETLLAQMKGRTMKDGRPVTQFTAIVDMDELGMKTVGSVAIIQAFKEIVTQFESNYPEVLKACYMINAFRIFQILFGILKPLLSERTAGKMHILTTAPKWRPVLLEALDADQLPEIYGGTRDSSLHKFLKYTLRSEVEKSFRDVTVPAGDVLQVPIEVLKENSCIKWEFTTEYYDIDFFITFNDKTVVSKQKLDSHKNPATGSYKCKAPGTYVLNFDNSYSRMRSKALRYSVKVEERTSSKKK